jgi:quercetin dioxygenase-like cupin family protein
MNIQEIILKAAESNHPIAAALHHGEETKVTAIAFKSGTFLKAHTSPVAAKLLVISGEVRYKSMDQESVLKAYAEHPIPPGIEHEVFAETDSLCLLIQIQNNY